MILPLDASCRVHWLKAPERIHYKLAVVTFVVYTPTPSVVIVVTDLSQL